MTEKSFDAMIDEMEMKEVEGTGGFEAEIYLSTDGKHTVHVKANTPDGRKAAMKWAKVVFDRIKTRYGTKQELNKETYKEDLGNCPKCNAPMLMSSKNKPYCSKLCWKNE